MDSAQKHRTNPTLSGKGIVADFWDAAKSFRPGGSNIQEEDKMNVKTTSTIVCRTMLRPAVFVCLMLLAAGAQAQFNYETNNGTITIDYYYGTGGDVVIPGTINNLPVTCIGTNAFEDANLTSVTIPGSVTNIAYGAFSYSSLGSITIGTNVISIGNNAFFDCKGLTSVTIPSSVITIGNIAFEYTGLTNLILGTNVASIGNEAFSLTSLTNVTIPASVTNIGGAPFAYDNLVPAINVASNNPAYSSVNGVLFNKNQTTLIEFPDGKVVPGYTYTIPGTVTSIADNAFGYCATLLGVTIPNSVTNIGVDSFFACRWLGSITIPNSVRTLDDYAFYCCESLTNVVIGTNVTSIGSNAFNSCNSLTGITIPGAVTNIGDGAFLGCTVLMTITVAANNPAYISVDGVLFNKSQTTLIQYPTRGARSYTIPGSVTNLADNAFAYCTTLTNVTIPGSVTSLGEGAFWYCTFLTNVCFEGNAPIDGGEVFTNDPSLSAIYYVNGATGWGSTYEGIPTALCQQCASTTGGFGSLQVTISPPTAITAGARWQVDGGAWQKSSVTVSNLSVTNHTLTFSSVSGWTAPASQTIAIEAGQTTTATGTYASATQTATITLGVSPTGAGTVTGAGTFKTGSSHTVKASANSGYLFAGWTENGSVVASSPGYTFTLSSNCSLVATFVTNPFTSVAGNYAGLFYDTNAAGVTVSNAGYVTAKVTPTGGFSASLQEPGQTVSFSGQFSSDGLWQTNAIKGAPGLSASLQLNLSGGNQIIGAISNAAWTAQLTATLVAYSKTNPAPWAGHYTLVIPGSQDFAGLPGGNGAAAVSVSPLGIVTLSGTLGDGSTVTETTFVSAQGQWPLYSSLYSKKGLILGWMTFTNDVAATNELEGEIAWIKPEGTAKNPYPSGFDWPYDEASYNAFGSAFTNQTPLLAWTNGVVILQNGNLAQSITNSFEIGSGDKVTATNGLKLTFTTSGTKAGLFSGSVVNPATKKAISFNGALLQNQNTGCGVFLGTNQSGSLYLGPVQPSTPSGVASL
jgi:hypothetical protein